MTPQNEQGFLSDKFSDWSGEPIPNGWNEIDNKLRPKSRRRAWFWWLFPSLFLVGTAGYLSIQESRRAGSPDSLAQSGVKEAPVSARKAQPARPEPSTPPQENSTREVSPKAAANPTPESGAPQTETRQSATSTPPTDQTPAGTPKARSAQKPGQQLAIAPPSGEENGSGFEAKFESRKPFTKSRKRVWKSGKNASASSRVLATRITLDPREAVNQPPLPESPPSQSGDNQAEGSLQTSEQASNRAALPSGLAYGPNVDFLYPRLPGFVLPGLEEPHPQEVPVEWVAAPLPREPFRRKATFGWTVQAAMGQNEIAINQSEGHHHMKVDNLKRVQSGLFGLGFQAQVPIVSWLQGFAGAQLSLFHQRLDIVNTPRTPTGFGMAADQGDSLRFEVKPVWAQVKEVRTQTLALGQTEIGIQPLVLRGTVQSGPFAALVLWARIWEGHRSSTGAAGDFLRAEKPLAAGYRVGYRHSAGSWQWEAFLSSLPTELAAQTKGLSINTRLLGVGIRRQIGK